jgi:hypothetical protein
LQRHRLYEAVSGWPDGFVLPVMVSPVASSITPPQGLLKE